MNRTIKGKEEAFRGAEVYKKTPDEKLASKAAKSAHKAWLKEQPKVKK